MFDIYLLKQKIQFKRLLKIYIKTIKILSEVLTQNLFYQTNI